MRTEKYARKDDAEFKAILGYTFRRTKRRKVLF
jgi:hypothetical protein